MTLLEAAERAKKIWGDGQVDKLEKAYGTKPGETDWDVRLNTGTWHGFDCNGHPTCHHECNVVSVEVCP